MTINTSLENEEAKNQKETAADCPTVNAPLQKELPLSGNEGDNKNVQGTEQFKFLPMFVFVHPFIDPKWFPLSDISDEKND